jgi:hypothetical protein
MAAGVVKLDQANAIRFQRFVAAHEQGNSGPINDLLLAWWKRYRVFTLRRFDAFSRGNGTWKPLALSTIRARRKGKKTTGQTKARRKGRTVMVAGRYSILVDNGQLKASLGSENLLLNRRVGNAVDFGFGAAPHRASGLTMGQLATVHHFGTKHIPARPILVKPDGQTIQQMSNDGRRLERRFKAVLPSR